MLLRLEFSHRFLYMSTSADAKALDSGLYQAQTCTLKPLRLRETRFSDLLSVSVFVENQFIACQTAWVKGGGGSPTLGGVVGDSQQQGEEDFGIER